MNNSKRSNKHMAWQMTVLMSAILTGCGSDGGTTAAVAPVTPIGVTASPSIAVSSQAAIKSSAYSIVPTTPSITVSGIYPKMVSPVLTGSGSINVVNNALAHVAATQTGAGTLSIVAMPTTSL